VLISISLQWQDGGLGCQGLTLGKDRVFVFAIAPKTAVFPTGSFFLGRKPGAARPFGFSS
jgi:hypothetical protein